MTKEIFTNRDQAEALAMYAEDERISAALAEQDKLVAPIIPWSPPENPDFLTQEEQE